MSYTALYRKFRPTEFEDEGTRSHYYNIKKSDKGREDRTCLFVLRNKGNRENDCGEDICQSSEL